TVAQQNGQEVVQLSCFDIEVALHERFRHPEVAVAENTPKELLAVDANRHLGLARRASAASAADDMVATIDAETDASVHDVLVEQVEEDVPRRRTVRLRLRRLQHHRVNP